MGLWGPHAEMLGSISVSYEYFILGLVYIWLGMLFRRDIFANSTAKYLNMFKVLPDFYLSFLRDDDCFVYYTLCCWQSIP